MAINSNHGAKAKIQKQDYRTSWHSLHSMVIFRTSQSLQVSEPVIVFKILLSNVKLSHNAIFSVERPYHVAFSSWRITFHPLSLSSVCHQQSSTKYLEQKVFWVKCLQLELFVLWRAQENVCLRADQSPTLAFRWSSKALHQILTWVTWKFTLVMSPKPSFSQSIAFATQKTNPGVQSSSSTLLVILKC